MAGERFANLSFDSLFLNLHECRCDLSFAMTARRGPGRRRLRRIPRWQRFERGRVTGAARANAVFLGRGPRERACQQQSVRKLPRATLGEPSWRARDAHTSLGSVKWCFASGLRGYWQSSGRTANASLTRPPPRCILFPSIGVHEVDASLSSAQVRSFPLTIRNLTCSFVRTGSSVPSARMRVFHC